MKLNSQKHLNQHLQQVGPYLGFDKRVSHLYHKVVVAVERYFPVAKGVN